MVTALVSVILSTFSDNTIMHLVFNFLQDFVQSWSMMSCE